jgi:hypothetical protein
VVAFAGKRKRPVVSGTVQKAAGHVAAAFQNHLQPSPFHIKSSNQLLPFAKHLFEAFDNIDPATKQQFAITRELLQGTFRLTSLMILETRHSLQQLSSPTALPSAAKRPLAAQPPTMEPSHCGVAPQSHRSS